MHVRSYVDLEILSQVQTGSLVHPASNPMDTWALSPQVKRLEREADHSPPSSAEVKNYAAILPPFPCGGG
jgi:hypothetical protein